jgi:hypothetical protein
LRIKIAQLLESDCGKSRSEIGSISLMDAQICPWMRFWMSERQCGWSIDLILGATADGWWKLDAMMRIAEICTIWSWLRRFWAVKCPD